MTSPTRRLSPGRFKKFGGVSTLIYLSKSVGMERLKNSLPKFTYPAAMAIALLFVWQYTAEYLKIPSYLLPTPGLILHSFIENWRIILVNLWPTLNEVLIGYLLSVVIGIPLAMMIVYSPLLERLIYPPMVVSQAIPKIAVAPLFIVWMGYGVAPKICIAFLISFFPIVIDTVVGLRAIPPEMIQLGRSMGGGRLRLFLKLRLPNAMPNLFGGLKIAITLAVVGAITGEFVGAQSGLGYLLTSASGNMETPLVFAVLVTISAVALILFMAVELLERLSVPWHSFMCSGETVGR